MMLVPRRPTGEQKRTAAAGRDALRVIYRDWKSRSRLPIDLIHFPFDCLADLHRFAVAFGEPGHHDRFRDIDSNLQQAKGETSLSRTVWGRQLPVAVPIYDDLLGA